MRRTTYTSYKTTSNFSIFKLFSLVFVFGAFGYVIYYAAANQDSITNKNMEPELISPIAGAVKVRAENPGGMNIPNQDKEVFDLLEETKPAQVAMEKEELCSGEEGAILCNKEVNRVQPLKEVVATVEKTTEQATQTIASLVEETENTAQEIQEKIAETAESTKEKLVTAIQPTAEQKAEIAQAEETMKTIEPAAGPSKEEMNKVAKQITEGSTTPKGAGFGVQLASYGSKENADNGVEYYRKKLGDMLSGLTYYTETVDVKGRTYYRVQMFGLASKEKANSLCTEIKAQKENCMPVVR